MVLINLLTSHYPQNLFFTFISVFRSVLISSCNFFQINASFNSNKKLLTFSELLEWSESLRDDSICQQNNEMFNCDRGHYYGNQRQNKSDENYWSYAVRRHDEEPCNSWVCKLMYRNILLTTVYSHVMFCILILKIKHYFRLTVLYSCLNLK